MSARILLAEDDDSLRGFLARALERAGHEVIACADGEAKFVKDFAAAARSMFRAARNRSRMGQDTTLALRMKPIRRDLKSAGSSVWVAAFAFAMLEVSDSMILAQQAAHFPITKAIYSLIMSLGNGPQLASALGVWSMIFLTVTIVGASLLLGKKLGALFR